MSITAAPGAAFEGFVRAGAALAADGEPSMDQLLAIAARNGIELLGPIPTTVPPPHAAPVRTGGGQPRAFGSPLGPDVDAACASGPGAADRRGVGVSDCDEVRADAGPRGTEHDGLWHSEGPGATLAEAAQGAPAKGEQ